MTGFERRPLVLEATALPTQPQPLPYDALFDACRAMQPLVVIHQKFSLSIILEVLLCTGFYLNSDRPQISHLHTYACIFHHMVLLYDLFGISSLRKGRFLMVVSSLLIFFDKVFDI